MGPLPTSATEVWKQERNDPTGFPLNRTNPLDLSGQEGFELRREMDDPSLGVLGLPRIQPKRAGVEVHLAALKGKHLALHPPAVGLRDCRGSLKIWSESVPDCVVLGPFERSPPSARRPAADLPRS